MKALFSHLSSIALMEQQYGIQKLKKDFQKRIIFSLRPKRIAIYSYEYSMERNEKKKPEISTNSCVVKLKEIKKKFLQFHLYRI